MPICIYKSKHINQKKFYFISFTFTCKKIKRGEDIIGEEKN